MKKTHLDTQIVKGSLREENLPSDAYFSDLYFSIPQLCSFAHQLHHIWFMRPKNILEIGIGNGFTSSFLRRTGLSVTTADINKDLKPDICAPINELKKHLDNKFDLVVCCEVLEHMPLSRLEENLNHLRELGNSLFMTLPNANRTYGLGGIAFMPKINPQPISFTFDFPYKHDLTNNPHFWEVGHNIKCTKRAIVKKLKKLYNSVTYGKFSTNPYHIYFECK